MKRIFLSLAIVMAALVSCTKESENMAFEMASVLAQADDFTIDEALTKTTLTQSGNDAPSFAWKAGDVIGVIPMDGKTVQSNYEIASIGSDPKTATFDGGVWALKEWKTYAAYYPYQKEAVLSGETLEFSFQGQKQESNNSLSHIGAYDYMYASPVVASSSATSFSFKHLVSLVRMQITVPQTDVYTDLTIESTESWFAGKAELTLSNGTMTATQILKTCNIALNNIAVNTGEVLTVWFSMLPTAALNGKAITVKLFGKDSSSTAEISNLKIFEAGKAYSFSCAPGSQEETGWVDLGLSVKWATCNLGASKPEEYGDYYAWGEVETKDYYSETTYKFIKVQHFAATEDEYDSEGFLIKEGQAAHDENRYTKYIPESEADSYGFEGFYDDKTILDPEDDVAHVTLGGKWRMPTKAECDELKNNCQCDWVTYKGIKGRKFTSKKSGYTDKWIFLPAAGFHSNYGLNYVGSTVIFWSSSLLTGCPNSAYTMYFDSTGGRTSSDYRCSGRSVRPVSE